MAEGRWKSSDAQWNGALPFQLQRGTIASRQTKPTPWFPYAPGSNGARHQQEILNRIRTTEHIGVCGYGQHQLQRACSRLQPSNRLRLFRHLKPDSAKV